MSKKRATTISQQLHRAIRDSGLTSYPLRMDSRTKPKKYPPPALATALDVRQRQTAAGVRKERCMNVRIIPHKRDKTKWAVDYRCPITKKRKYESFDTKAEAKDRKKELEGQYATGKYRPVHRRAWAEFIAEYEDKILNHQRYQT